MKYLISSLLFLITASAQAQSCNLSNVLNFSAYAINSMTISQSDFQGLTGAGNQITARNFRFGPMSGYECGLSVSVGNFFQGYSGTMDGNLEITNPGGSYSVGQMGYGNFSIPYVQASQFVNHSAVAAHLQDLSIFLNSLKSSSAKVTASGKKLSIVTGKDDVQVVHLTAGMLTTGRNIELIGTSNQTLVINIHGDNYLMSDLTLTVNGLFVRNIIWNFADATNLRIARIGGNNTTYSSNDSYDSSLGLQGFVIAPKATVAFSMTKITGSLLAQNIMGTVGPTGQINIAPVQGPTSPCLTINNPACQVKTPVKPVPEKPLE